MSQIFRHGLVLAAMLVCFASLGCSNAPPPAVQEAESKKLSESKDYEAKMRGQMGGATAPSTAPSTTPAPAPSTTPPPDGK